MNSFVRVAYILRPQRVGRNCELLASKPLQRFLSLFIPSQLELIAQTKKNFFCSVFTKSGWTYTETRYNQTPSMQRYFSLCVTNSGQLNERKSQSGGQTASFHAKRAFCQLIMPSCLGRYCLEDGERERETNLNRLQLREERAKDFLYFLQKKCVRFFKEKQKQNRLIFFFWFSPACVRPRDYACVIANGKALSLSTYTWFSSPLFSFSSFFLLRKTKQKKTEKP